MFFFQTNLFLSQKHWNQRSDASEKFLYAPCSRVSQSLSQGVALRVCSQPHHDALLLHAAAAAAAAAAATNEHQCKSSNSLEVEPDNFSSVLHAWAISSIYHTCEGYNGQQFLERRLFGGPVTTPAAEDGNFKRAVRRHDCLVRARLVRFPSSRQAVSVASTGE